MSNPPRKGILKKPSGTESPMQGRMMSSVPPETRQYLADRNINPHPRHLAIAMQHAHQIQARKDTENLILDRILGLTSLPTDPNTDPSNPLLQDVNTLKNALLPFQPSDYDNLILERNIEGLCGYALCPRPHRREPPHAKFRVVWGVQGTGPGGRGKSMKVVTKEEHEKWCSDECAERAVYLRVQLIEQPAWERAVGSAPQLVLLEEGRARRKGYTPDEAKREEEVNVLQRGMERLGVNANANSGAGMDESVIHAAHNLGKLSLDQRQSANPSMDHRVQLAIERGEGIGSPAFPTRMDVEVLDRMRTGALVKPPEPSASGPASAGAIEGYEPKQLGRSNGQGAYASHGKDEDDDDILPQI
ncbi:hypothetical protein KEM55_004153 [Ascosphaera atra]|nr:hypothetical protein KEM55_004153 [Ascosphaera atra]